MAIPSGPAAVDDRVGSFFQRCGAYGRTLAVLWCPLHAGVAVDPAPAPRARVILLTRAQRGTRLQSGARLWRTRHMASEASFRWGTKTQRKLASLAMWRVRHR